MERDPIDMVLLGNWQRDLPIVSRPFALMAKQLETTEPDIIARLKRLSRQGAISRVGGIIRPNVLGASTLAAMPVPNHKVEVTAAIIGEEPGVNHSYLRENEINLWFVVTGPDRAHVKASLARIEKRTGQRVFDLRLRRSYHIDLGFPLNGDGPKHREPDDTLKRGLAFKHQIGDAQLVQQLTHGLPLDQRPFQSIASQLGRSEASVISRLKELSDAGIIKRIGVIVRHRTLGWRSNAMVVWDVAPVDIDRAGTALAEIPGITLCYRRTRIENGWPYNLYCMVHAKKRSHALKVIASAGKAADLAGCPRQILFSTRCFKQTGALVAAPMEAAQ